MKLARRVKVIPFAIVCAGAFALAGCQHQPTLEEAQAACAKEGGFLVVFYSQKVTMAGLGPPIATPGNCMSAGKFDKASTAPATPPSGVE